MIKDPLPGDRQHDAISIVGRIPRIAEPFPVGKVHMAIGHNQVEPHSDWHIDPQPVPLAEVPNCSTGWKLLRSEKHPESPFNKGANPSHPHWQPTQETGNSKTYTIRLQFHALGAFIWDVHTFGKCYANRTAQPQTPDKVSLCGHRERCNPDVSVIHIRGHKELTGNRVASDRFRGLRGSAGGKRKKKYGDCRETYERTDDRLGYTWSMLCTMQAKTGGCA